MTWFLGKPTTQTHVTTHPDGTTTTTVVTCSSPWDERSRQAAFDLYDDDADRCPQCGLPRDECQDKDKDWFPQLAYCWRTAAQQSANREWLNKHEKAKPNESGLLPTDGARVFVTPVDLGMGGEFLARDDGLDNLEALARLIDRDDDTAGGD